MFEAIIFDMDGVLVKSENANYLSYIKALAKYGVKPDPENRKRDLGRSLKDKLELIKKEHPQVPKDLSVGQLSKELFQYQMEILKDELVPDQALLSFIRGLKENSIKIGVATSSLKYRAEAFLRLKGIIGLLDTIVAADDVSRHKPHPDLFLETAKRLGITPENCVVIEDARNGIEAAKSAKMKAIGLITENQSAEELKRADAVISSIAELDMKKIKGLF